jgi:hypothetical protein
LPGQDANLQRADDSPPVPAIDVAIGDRIALFELLQQYNTGACLQVSPQIEIRLRERRQGGAERFQVKTGTADHQGNHLPLIQSQDNGTGQLRETVGIAELIRREDADEMMRNAAQLIGSRLTRQDVESLINLESVGADNFGLEALGQIQGQVGLADTGRPGKDLKGRRLAFGVWGHSSIRILRVGVIPRDGLVSLKQAGSLCYFGVWRLAFGVWGQSSIRILRVGVIPRD